MEERMRGLGRRPPPEPDLDKKAGRGSRLFIGIAFLLRMCWKYRKSTLVFLGLVCLLGGVLPFASIVFPKFILDELTGAQDVSRIIFFVAALLLCTLFGNTLLNFLRTRYELGQAQIEYLWELDNNTNLYEADLQNIESSSFRDLSQKAFSFLRAEYSGWSAYLRKTADIVSNIITVTGIVSILALLNPLVVFVFIAMVILNTIFSAETKKRNVKIRREFPVLRRRLNYHLRLFEDQRFAKELRINTLGAWLLVKVREAQLRMFDFTRLTMRNDLLAQLFNNGATFIQQAVAYGYLVYAVIDGRFTIGTFSMCLAAINSFSGSMFNIMNNLVDIRRYSDYYDAVEEFVNLPKRQREGKNLPLRFAPSSPPEIEFRDVSFKYPGGKKYSLRHVNLTIRAGEKLSMVGENGAGKTSLIKLLMRLYRPDEGVILINGVDIRDYAFEDYEKIFSVVLQDFALFSMSLRDNVALGREIPDDRIIDALRESGLSEKFDRLDKGLDTSIYKEFDDTGFEPSGGEGQKLALARALLKDAPVVILDEPTAALDPRAEYEIYRNFNRMVAGKTAIFISHRLSSAQFCDKIAVLREGEIVEYGSHQELIARKGLYEELFSLQAQFYG